MKTLFVILLLSFGVARAATSASQFGITWTWTEDLTVGQFVNGDYYVVAPSGITLTSITPASTLTGTRIISGSMVNPIAKDGAGNGFDNAIGYNVYVPALNIARPGGNQLSVGNPAIVAAGSSIVSSISFASAGVRPQLTDAAVLTVLASAPPANSFRPPYCGTDKSCNWQIEDINWSLLRSLAPVTGTPSVAAAAGYFARPWIEIQTDGNAGRYLHPENNQPDYARDMAWRVGTVMMMMHFAADEADKRAYSIGLIQYGLDVYGAVRSGGVWRDLGSQNQGRKAPMVMAALLFNDPAILAYANAQSHFKFQEDRQTFYVAQVDVDRGHPAHAHCNESYLNVTERAHMPATCNRYCSGGNDGDNRQRDVYTTAMIGLPEWGEQHTSQPIRDGSNWTFINYRRTVYNSLWANILAIDLIPGGRAAWNWPVLFEYMDRARTLEGGPGSEQANNPPEFEWAAWNTYRSLGGPIWSETTVAPTISTQPGNRSVLVGVSTSFTLAASGTPAPSYQWRKDGINLTNGGRVSGATSASLAIAAVELGDVGYYDCIISNAGGFVVSTAAFLEVNAVEPTPTPNATPGRRRDRGQRLLGTGLN